MNWVLKSLCMQYDIEVGEILSVLWLCDTDGNDETIRIPLERQKYKNYFCNKKQFF